ncbi:HET-domain-containing protein, partial [Hyaloscypha bicolor E]
PWYPTRLLDVGINSDSLIKLHTTSFSEPQGPYLTLSHRWGGEHVLKLISGNLESFHNGVAINSLPRTFAEAVEITRRLNIRHLWIDSLCIIQDSIGDWRKESLLMEKVYSHTHLNISATASENCHSGLFRSRPPIPDWPWFVDLTVEEHGKKRCFIYPSNLLGSLDDLPLNKRAWVLQERILPTRILSFSDTQLFWECRKTQGCEMFPEHLPLTACGDAALSRCIEPSAIEERLRFNSSSGNYLPPSQYPYLMWYFIVDNYMTCGLTKMEDKLVAISGLAKRISKLVNDDYLAGLWRSTLPTSLVWEVSNCIQSDGTTSSRPPQYRAPTWSWASVEGMI